MMGGVRMCRVGISGRRISAINKKEERKSLTLLVDVLVE